MKGRSKMMWSGVVYLMNTQQPKLENKSSEDKIVVINYDKFEDYSTEFYSILMANRRLSKLDLSNEDLTYFLQCIDLFNTVTCNTVMINSISFENISIPTAFKDMVYPIAVTFNTLNYLTKDYLLRPKATLSYDQFDFSKYNMIIDKLMFTFRLSSLRDVTKLSELKSKETLYPTIAENISYNKFVKSQHEAVIPIPVTYNVFYNDQLYYNHPTELVVIEAFRRMCRACCI